MRRFLFSLLIASMSVDDSSKSNICTSSQTDLWSFAASVISTVARKCQSCHTEARNTTIRCVAGFCVGRLALTAVTGHHTFPCLLPPYHRNNPVLNGSCCCRRRLYHYSYWHQRHSHPDHREGGGMVSTHGHCSQCAFKQVHFQFKNGQFTATGRT